MFFVVIVAMLSEVDENVYINHVQKGNSCAEKYTLHLYSVNGKHMSRESVSVPISDMVISGNYLFYGDVHGTLVIKELHGFVVPNTFE